VYYFLNRDEGWEHGFFFTGSVYDNKTPTLKLGTENRQLVYVEVCGTTLVP
jgi:hypothetical protein